MEVERATPPGFEEEILKPPEVSIPIGILMIVITLVIFYHLPNRYHPL